VPGAAPKAARLADQRPAAPAPDVILGWYYFIKEGESASFFHASTNAASTGSQVRSGDGRDVKYAPWPCAAAAAAALTTRAPCPGPERSNRFQDFEGDKSAASMEEFHNTRTNDM
jgi:hypothetical protein